MLPLLVLVMTIFSRPFSAFVLKHQQSLLSRTSYSTRSTNRMLLFSTTRRLAETLIQCVVDKNSTVTTNNLRACVVVAGGGGTAISTLASTPGASNLLVEGRVLYDPHSIVHFLTNNNPKHSSKKLSSFCSKETAIALANSALYTSLVLTPSLSSRISCVGIGCTSVLVSNTPHKGQHRCYVALVASNGSCKLYSCTFSKNHIIQRNTTEETQTTTKRPRTRVEEEELVSSIILYALLKHLREQMVTTYITQVNTMLPLIDDVLATLHDDTLLVHGEDMLTEEDVAEGISTNQNNKLLENAVRRVLTNTITTPKGDTYANADTSCLLLVPVKDSTHQTVSLTPISPITLPKNVIIFPGSFNPPHEGHMMLARAAVKYIWDKQKKQQQQQKRQDPTIILYEEQTPCVVFEMSITNADKPPMDLSEVMRRIQLFCSSSLDLPQDWSILLTSTPLFVEKILLFSNVVLDTKTSNYDEKPTVVIGSDTLIRILDPKYYENNSQSAMFQALGNMKEKGVHFVVGGRVEQKKKNYTTSKPFISGEEQLALLPEDLREHFTILNEDEFRMDISSTELRKKGQL